jgi:Domain of unknown function (DUF397)
MPGRTLTTGPKISGGIVKISGGIVNLSAADWRKSSHSGPNGCLEFARVEDHVAVRDSKQKDGPVLVFTLREWEEFLGGAADGQFPLPVRTSLD